MEISWHITCGIVFLRICGSRVFLFVAVPALVQGIDIFANHVVETAPKRAHTLEFLANADDTLKISVELIHRSDD